MRLRGRVENGQDKFEMKTNSLYKDLEDEEKKTEFLLRMLKGDNTVIAKLTTPVLNWLVEGNLTRTDDGLLVFGQSVMDDQLPQTAALSVQRQPPVASLNVLYDPEVGKKFKVFAGRPNHRNFRADIYRVAGRNRVDDVTFFVRLNNSRLLTSQLRWRPELKHDIKMAVNEYISNWHQFLDYTYEDFLEFADREWEVKGGAIQSSLMESLNPDLEQVMSDYEDMEEELEDIHDGWEEAYDDNHFYIRDIYEFISNSFSDFSSEYDDILEKFEIMLESLLENFGDLGVSVQKLLQDVLNWVRDLMDNSRRSSVSLSDTFIEILRETAEAYRKLTRILSWRLLSYWHDQYTEVRTYLMERFITPAIERLRPQLLLWYDTLEYTVWVGVRSVSNYVYDEVTSSPYYHRLAALGEDIDQLYRDLTTHDGVTNVKKYVRVVKDFIRQRYGELSLISDVGGVITDLRTWWSSLSQNSLLLDTLNVAYQKINWIYSYLNVSDRIRSAAVAVYNDGQRILTQTAVEASYRYHEGKTVFVMLPDKGLISLKQLLPMTWDSLTDPPNFETLPEVQFIYSIKEMFESSDDSFWDAFYYYKPDPDPFNWIPPFKAQAVIAGGEQFITFDGRVYKFGGQCTYLLAGDLIDGNFYVFAKYDRRGESSQQSIIVRRGEHEVVIKSQYKVTVDGATVELPIAVGELRLFRSGGNVYVDSNRGMRLVCNVQANVCTLSIVGWYYGRVGGLFGTYDNEPLTDFWLADRQPNSDVAAFAKSWSVPSCRSSTNVAVTRVKKDVVCRAMFDSPESDYETCFALVNPAPYLELCEMGAGSLSSRCTTARAYVAACSFHGVPLKIPNKCVSCDFNGEQLTEGQTRYTKGRKEKPMSDVVFIIEAKDCNRDVRTRRNLDRMVATISQQLTRSGITDTRFAVVTFGGEDIYSDPRLLTVRSEVFSPQRAIGAAFDRIPTGNYSMDNDVFGAIAYATRLPFRAEASKTLILLPCSSCSPAEMTVDYDVLHRVLLEQSMTLHVLMDHDFTLPKRRLAKIFYGMDGTFAYTQKDEKEEPLEGDTTLHRQVRVPKKLLGHCVPLALETNGTLFTAKKLEPSAGRRDNKKFLTVFSKRVAQTAEPADCENCECVLDVDGSAVIKCRPCIYPQPAYIDFEFQSDQPARMRSGRPGRGRNRGANDSDSREEDDDDDDDDDDNDEQRECRRYNRQGVCVRYRRNR